MTDQETFSKKVDEAIGEHAMLKHPFYQLWSEGKLSREALAEYAKQYYAQVRAFPTYVSAVHSHCENVEARQMLLENLIEEERGSQNHPELWLRFAEGLGVNRMDVESADLLPATRESVATLKSLTQSENFTEGLAALYAYESQIPEVAKTKREGLAAFYGISDERTVSFFRVHEEADVIHRQVERSLLAKHCRTQESQDKVIQSARQAAKALWTFLDGAYGALVGQGQPMACSAA